ncbi:hypothetical protein AC249_AIPGENE10542 [Exaiptasia diaphana]|nr:hypothetical protein AC249_AIPGENE10542 [Exaiptasia diaphana]
MSHESMSHESRYESGQRFRFQPFQRWRESSVQLRIRVRNIDNLTTFECFIGQEIIDFSSLRKKKNNDVNQDVVDLAFSPEKKIKTDACEYEDVVDLTISPEKKIKTDACEYEVITPFAVH